MTAKTVDLPESSSTVTPLQKALLGHRRWKFFGLTADDLIKYFFAGNAWMSIVVLFLITLSLFFQAVYFFPKQYDSLRIYRLAGLEYVDILQDRIEEAKNLRRFITTSRIERSTELEQAGKTPEEIALLTAPMTDVASRMGEASGALEAVIGEVKEKCVTIKERYLTARDNADLKAKMLAAGQKESADQLEVEEVDFSKEIQGITSYQPQATATLIQFQQELNALNASVGSSADPVISEKLDKAKKKIKDFAASLPLAAAELQTWDQAKPVHYYEVITSFLFGTAWVTQSFWQEWYGFLPLLAGSLTVCFEALLIAVPLGVGAAIYVNQVAGPLEQNVIKPCIEFIAALPSVVLGFFGVVILSGLVVQFSVVVASVEWLKPFFPFFPLHAGLNATTAALLLALMAIPTIFSLSEDAINNVPRSYKEASFALGATRLQTTLKIIVPAALSGIISASLLGLGRVIGETMVVLLCSGGAIQIPDFSNYGLGALFAPVHTMTGLIAQEVPETPKASLQWGALFMLALTLFFMSLFINWLAQIIVRRFKISVG